MSCYNTHRADNFLIPKTLHYLVSPSNSFARLFNKTFSTISVVALLDLPERGASSSTLLRLRLKSTTYLLIVEHEEEDSRKAIYFGDKTLWKYLITARISTNSIIATSKTSATLTACETVIISQNFCFFTAGQIKLKAYNAIQSSVNSTLSGLGRNLSIYPRIVWCNFTTFHVTWLYSILGNSWEIDEFTLLLCVITVRTGIFID